MQYLQGQRILILGLGISGLSMARWCARCGAVLRVADTRANPPGLQILKNQVSSIEFIAGDFDITLLGEGEQQVTRILISPGLMPDDAGLAITLDAAKVRGISIQGEVALFAEALAEIDTYIRAKEQALLDTALQVRAEKEKEKAQALTIQEQSDDLESDSADLLIQNEQIELNEPSILLQDKQNNVDAPVSEKNDLLKEVVEQASLSSEEAIDKAVLATVEQSIAQAYDLNFDLEALFAEVQEPVVQEVEEPLPLVQGYQPKVLAITGTNGKTTVTSLTATLVASAGKSVVAAGNIGLAMMDALIQKLDEEKLPEVWVLELSSFQLNGAVSFNPTAATILNITQDHLDWHGNMGSYIEAKGHIFGENTVRVLNREDREVMSFKPVEPITESALTTSRKRRAKRDSAIPQMVTFGTNEPQRAGDFGIVEEGGVAWLVQAQSAHETVMHANAVIMKLLMPVDVLRIRGKHNASNALAALALAEKAGCNVADLLFGLRAYRGEPHRVEFVGAVRGVEYIDDSKGTNVGATAAALASFGEDYKVVLILGGQGKDQDFSLLVSLIKQYVRAVVLIGQDATLIENALKDTSVPMLHAQTLPEAVEVCAKQAQTGDLVLLSPACASLDMFKNYVERSEVFINAVKALEDGKGDVV